MRMSEVVGRLAADGDVGTAWSCEHRDPVPLSPDALSLLRMPDGSPLVDELATWLAYDASWLPLLDETRSRFATRPLKAIFAEWAGAMMEGQKRPRGGRGPRSAMDLVRIWIDFLPSAALRDVPALLLPQSGSQAHVLMFEPGRSELRVLGSQQRFELWWKYQRFSDYAAHYFGFINPR